MYIVLYEREGSSYVLLVQKGKQLFLPSFEWFTVDLMIEIKKKAVLYLWKGIPLFAISLSQNPFLDFIFSSPRKTILNKSESMALYKLSHFFSSRTHSNTVKLQNLCNAMRWKLDGISKWEWFFIQVFWTRFPTNLIKQAQDVIALEDRPIQTQEKRNKSLIFVWALFITCNLLLVSLRSFF